MRSVFICGSGNLPFINRKYIYIFFDNENDSILLIRRNEIPAAKFHQQGGTTGLTAYNTMAV